MTVVLTVQMQLKKYRKSGNILHRLLCFIIQDTLDDFLCNYPIENFGSIELPLNVVALDFYFTSCAFSSELTILWVKI